MGLFKKNKEKKQDREKQSKKEAEEPEPEMEIHTMPKKFLHIHKEVKKAKGVGILIIFGGLLAVFATFAVLYYYVLSPRVMPEEKEPETQAEPKAQAESEEEPKPEEEKKEEPKPIPVEVEPVEVEPVEEEEPEPVEQEIKPAPDRDKDGLTDAEEIIFGCLDKPKDCDEDGFPDLDELLKLYNPAGAGRLSDNANISEYVNNSFNYSLLYPNIFRLESADGDNSIMISLEHNQFIQIIIAEKEVGQSIDDWYKEQMGVPMINAAQLVIRDDLRGIKTGDGLIYYFSRPNQERIYILSYNLGTTNILYYPNLFQAMVNSFKVND